MSPSRTNAAGYPVVQSMALLTVQDMSDDSASSFSESEQVCKILLQLIGWESVSLSLQEPVSCYNNQNFFEGVEKLLEVWFTSKKSDVHDCDLRKIPRCYLKRTVFTIYR